MYFNLNNQLSRSRKPLPERDMFERMWRGALGHLGSNKSPHSIAIRHPTTMLNSMRSHRHLGQPTELNLDSTALSGGACCCHCHCGPSGRSDVDMGDGAGHFGAQRIGNEWVIGARGAAAMVRQQPRQLRAVGAGRQGLRSVVSVTETHQVAEAQQEKNAKLREAFGISEYFVDGSSFDPDREAKEQVARSNALLERERQQQVDKAQAQRYQLVQTPSPEPEAQPAIPEGEGKKSKKRKHRDSSSSEEASSSKKKKKSKKRNKKERSEKSKDKKAKKKRRRSSKASSEESDDTGGSSNDDSTSDEERKKKKRKKKEKKKLKKKQASPKSSDSSRDSSPETRKQKPNQQKSAKAPDKSDSKPTISKVDYRRRDPHEEKRRRYSQSPPAQRDRERNRRSRSRDRDNNNRSYQPRRRSPEERPHYSPKRIDKADRYKTTRREKSNSPPGQYARSRSPSSDHDQRGIKSKKHDNGQHRSISRDKRPRSRSPRSTKKPYDNRYRSRSKSYSVERDKQLKPPAKRTRSRSRSTGRVLQKSFSKRTRSKSVEKPSKQKPRRSYSKSPEVIRLRHNESKERRRSRSRDERTKRRVSPKPAEKSVPDRSLSPEVITRRSSSTSPPSSQNDKYYRKNSASQERNKQTYRSKSIEKKQEHSRSRQESSKNNVQESSPPYRRKVSVVKQSQSKRTNDEESIKSRGKQLKVDAKSTSLDPRRRSTSSPRDSKHAHKQSADRYSPRDISSSPERKSSNKKDAQKKEVFVEALSKVKDDVSHKDSKKTKPPNDRSSREKSSTPDDKYHNKSGTTKKSLMEEVLLKINDGRSQRPEDRQKSPTVKPSKRDETGRPKSLMEEVLSKINADRSDKPKSLMEEVLSKINADKPALKAPKSAERYNRHRTPSPDPKSLRNSEALKQKSLMEDVLSKINEGGKPTKSTTPPRSSHTSESEKPKKTPKSSTKSREQKPVVCLRSTSDDENSHSGNEHEENVEHIENEMRVLRRLKSDLAAKAKESLERKRIPVKRTPSPSERKAIDPNTFDIQGPPAAVDKRDSTEEKVSQCQLFPSYDMLVKDARKSGSMKENASSSPAKKSRDKERKSRSNSADSQSRPRTSKSSKSKERKSRSRSKSKRKDRKSESSSSTSSYSSGERSSSSSSSSSDSSRSSRSRSRFSSGSRSSSSSSRSRSPSIPRRHGSPSFLDRRRITSARKRPIPYHRASPSTSPSSVSSYSSASPWYQRERNRNNIAATAVALPVSRSASVDSFRSPAGSPQRQITQAGPLET